MNLPVAEKATLIYGTGAHSVGLGRWAKMPPWLLAGLGLAIGGRLAFTTGWPSHTRPLECGCVVWSSLASVYWVSRLGLSM